MPFETIFKEFAEWAASGASGRIDTDPVACEILGEHPEKHPLYIKYIEEQAIFVMRRSMGEVDPKTVICASLDLMFNVGRYIQKQLDKEAKNSEFDVFQRHILSRTINEDVTQLLMLECGHMVTMVIPINKDCHKIYCSQCVNTYLHKEKENAD